MPTVAELSAPYGNFLLGPRPGPGVCEVCFDLTAGPARCHHCIEPEPAIAAVTPISYSVAHEQLHHALAGYKRPPHVSAARFQIELAAVLWRYLGSHEACLARAAGAAGARFAIVTTVPSGHPERDRTHPLHRIAAELVGPTRARYQRLLQRTGTPVPPRIRSREKFAALRALNGEPVLLIDDTWTTGANAGSAAATLRGAGAGPVGVLVIGRHLHRDYRDNARRLNALASPFDWDVCPHHTPAAEPAHTTGRSAPDPA